MTKIHNFRNYNLVLDWVGFNSIKPIENSEINSIAKSFLKLGFNSNYLSNQNNTWRSKQLLYQSKNKFELNFLEYPRSQKQALHWVGFQMNFAGNNAKAFYNILQNDQNNSQRLLTHIFTKFTLSRLDLHFFRETLPTDYSYKDFLKNTSDRVSNLKRVRNTQLENKILKIGNRQSKKYFRVYKKIRYVCRGIYEEQVSGLEFEIELKNRQNSLNDLCSHLKCQDFASFEKDLVLLFFTESRILFGLNDAHTDWIRDFFRRDSYQQNVHSLVSDYLILKKSSYAEKKHFVDFLVFLSFVKNLTGNPVSILNENYYEVEFHVNHFMEFVEVNKDSTYQRNKVLKFFRQLQAEPPLTNFFKDGSFRSCLAFPVFELIKKNSIWTIRIAISSRLYLYSYPFEFSFDFCNFRTKIDYEVRFELLITFCHDNRQKMLNISGFIDGLRISNQRKTQVKRLFVKLIKELQNWNYIESSVSIQPKQGKSFEVEIKDLNEKILSKSRYILFFEVIFDS